MKGLAIGDLLCPTDKMRLTFEVPGVKETVDTVLTTNFENKDRADIRRTWRVIEDGGPGAEPAPQNMKELIAEADYVALHICPLSAEMISAARNLKVILTARGGLENIDMDAANARRIPVIHTPHHNAQAVAEYTVGLIIAETRNIARSAIALSAISGSDSVWREYYPNSENIMELRGSNLGLLGFGETGSLVAKKMRSFDLGRLLVFDPFVSAEAIQAEGGEKCDLETVLTESDVVSLHVRLSSETSGMISARELKLMKESAFLINAARSGLVVTNDLVKALREGWIKGAAIDVFDIEPAPPDNPLFRLDNVTVTNHRAGDTRNSYWKAPFLMGEQLALLLKGETPKYVVNKNVLR